MATINKILFVCLLSIILTCSRSIAQNLNADSKILSTAQVDNAIKKGIVTVIDARNISEEDYLDEHLPGAIRLNNHMLTQTERNVPGMLLPDRELEKVIANAGLSRESNVVVYSAGETPKDWVDAARVIAILNYSGIENTFYMDGGLAKWDAEDRPLEEGVVRVNRTNFKIHRLGDQPPIFCDLIKVKEILEGKDSAYFIDARSLDYFKGNDTDPRLVRHGHIPGAILIPVSLFSKNEGDYYTLKSMSEIKEILRTHGLSLDDRRPWISYCNTGHLASGIWFVANYCLRKGSVWIYDGSMAQYTRESVPQT